ncbi:MAG: SDR family oxidoreductase [Burkholderiales bacterium]|nr:SDR family oxidoreductase [Burkholderiales bacterium]
MPHTTARHPSPYPSSSSSVYPSLEGRAVFITGGGSGIGATLVERFAAQGARVAFIDIAEADSRALAERIAAQGTAGKQGKAGTAAPWWRRCDVRDIAALQAAIADAAAAIGDFDVLVNNVASDDRHALEAVTAAYYDERMAINQRAAFFALQAVVPGMKRRGGGAIVNIGSISWQIKQADFPVYAIAKSAVNGLTRTMARLLGPHRIRVNTVTPGWVMTERQKALWLTPESERDIERYQCLPDRLQPDDIAAMVLFLASDEARMCTAQEFVVDGGWS